MGRRDKTQVEVKVKSKIKAKVEVEVEVEVEGETIPEFLLSIGFIELRHLFSLSRS
jgi:hypothetical protein